MVRLRSPFSLYLGAFGLIIVNMATVFATVGTGFFPSDLAVYLGISYGGLCAATYIAVARITTSRSFALGARAKRLLGNALTRRNIFGFAVVQLLCGYAGFSHGAAAFYTLGFGRFDVATHVVASVKLKTKPGVCFKHQFSEFNWWVNNFYAPCSTVGYPPGSRFIFTGRRSALGFQYDSESIEAAGVPLRRRPSH